MHTEMIRLQDFCRLLLEINLPHNATNWHDTCMATDIAPRRLSEKQILFAENYILHGDAKLAAIAAGYTESTAIRCAGDMLRAPHILSFIQAHVKNIFAAEAPKSVRVLVELRDNVDVSAKVRADCARAVLDRAGHVAPRATAPDNATETPLHEMTVDQLKDLAGRLEGELAGRAKVVNGASASATDTQAIDLVG